MNPSTQQAPAADPSATETAASRHVTIKSAQGGAPAADTPHNLTEELLRHSLDNGHLDESQSEAFRRDMLAFLEDKTLPVSSSTMIHTIHRIANQQGYALTPESAAAVVNILVGETITGNSIAEQIAGLAQEYGDPLTEIEMDHVRHGNVIHVESRPAPFQPTENFVEE